MVVVLPCPAPCRPAPGIEYVTEAIGFVRCEARWKICTAADRHNLWNITISLQKRLTVAKERGVRKSVVLQDDPLRLVLEEPSDSAADRAATAKVLLAEQGMKLAGPVYRSGDPADLGAALCLAGPVRARPVCGDIEPRGPRCLDRLEYLHRGVGAVKDEEEGGWGHSSNR